MRMTLSEVMATCDDWEKFSDDHGWSVYAVAEGGGHIEVDLTLAQASKYGILRKDCSAT